jgi:AraC family transcriptional regulator of adaptative response/methylated-DNA-[protein]-cysteine methyltransferase
MTERITQRALDYHRVEEAIKYLEINFRSQPELTDIASAIGLSEYHFQRLFKRWVGISPKRFLQFLTKEYAKRLLEKSESILNVTYNAGLSSPGRLHDLFVQCEAVTPGEYKEQGTGLEIIYGFHQSQFGEYLLALTQRGICGLYFIHNDNHNQVLKKMGKIWRAAQFKESPEQTAHMADYIFSTSSWNQEKPFKLYLYGTNFQMKVWEALLKIPQGHLLSYEELAENVGNIRAVRAVGNAVARNPISYLIPCHRIIRKFGAFGNYQGGVARKKALIAWEAAQVEVGG